MVKTNPLLIVVICIQTHANTMQETKTQYITHHCKTTIVQQSFSYQGPFIWNSLPVNLKLATRHSNVLETILKNSYSMKQYK